jgi:copper chaperone
MLTFTLPQMTCGHCVRAVTQALHALDPQSQVHIDLPTHQLQVQTTAAPAAVVAQLTEAGYAPA